MITEETFDNDVTTSLFNAPKKIHMKSSGDGGGICHRPSTQRKPSRLQRDHSANIIIYLDHKDGVHIQKNRWGNTGKVSTKELINILTRILVEHVFDGRMTVFQEMMRFKLKGAIKKIVKEG